MITFGIVTDGKSEDNVRHMIQSIEDQLIPEYEILVVGNHGVSHPHTTVIPFDETQTAKGWITKKKNLITQNATWSNIVYAHDYIFFPEGWYEGFVKFHEWNDWSILINRVYTMEGPRHVDWAICPYDLWELIPELKDTWDVSLPYGTLGAQKLQYISGGFFMAQKHVMEEFPLDESLQWGDAEDVEWSRRVRTKYNFQFNKWSYVQLMKPNKWKPGLIKPEHLDRIAQLKNLKIYQST